MTLTPPQEALLARIHVCCLASPGGILFSGSHERISRGIHEVLHDFLRLIAGGYIGFVLMNEEWNMWIIPQEVIYAS